MLHEAWIRPEGDTPVLAEPFEAGSRARDFHRRLGGYTPSPVVRLRSATWGVAHPLLKYERSRFGLPSFKALGASWATYCALAAEMGMTADDLNLLWSDVGELQHVVGRTNRTTLVTATDGNHGRAVARMAQLLGLDAHILVPAGTASSRVQAIISEGARIEVIDGDYDDAVRASADLASRQGYLLVSDTSWDGYVEVPRWISEGYSTIFAELSDTVDTVALPDAVLVPVGVGALALAALRHYVPLGVPVVAVEPVGADCVTASLVTGTLTSVPGPHTSIMAGLNCGTPSMLAWPTLRDGLTGSLVVDDAIVKKAMVLLAEDGVAAGETGAAAAGALLALADEPEMWGRLGLDPKSRVVLLCTEGATDPDGYQRVVGRAPEEVDAVASV